MKGARREDARASRVLVLLALLGVLGALAPLLIPLPAYVTVVVRDPFFGSELTGQLVRLLDPRDGRAPSVAVRRVAGEAVAAFGRIRGGPVRLGVEVVSEVPDLFERATVETVLRPGEENRLVVDLVPRFGQVRLMVRDAQDSSRPVTAAVEVDGKPAGKGSEKVLSGLAPGPHRVHAEAAGYCPAAGEVTAKPREIVESLLPISKPLGLGELARFVLDWGEKPRDLDAHLYLLESQMPVRERHVYFCAKDGLTRSGQPWATLDVDFQHSEGFETITLRDRVDGRFRLVVQHWADPGAGTIGSSGAVVTMVTSNCERREIRPPASCAARGWSVLELEVKQGQLIRITETAVCADPLGQLTAAERLDCQIKGTLGVIADAPLGGSG